MYKGQVSTEFKPNYNYLKHTCSLKKLQLSQNHLLANRFRIQHDDVGYQLRKKVNQKLGKQYLLYENKKLRNQSSKKLNIGVKVRSLSAFNNQYIKQDNRADKLFNLSRPVPENQFLLNSRMQIKRIPNVNNQNLQNKIIVSDKKVSNCLDWSKKRKKKTRKLTENLQYQNISDRSTTLDLKMSQKLQVKNDKIQFKKTPNKLYKHNKNFSFLKMSMSQSNNFQLLVKTFKNKQENTFRKFKKSDFQIGRKLGSGNFSNAYLARHKTTGFICALKIMQKLKIKAQNYESQIARQIKIQSYLKHQNVVQMYGVFEDQQYIYFLTQLCTDGHLFSMIRKHTRLQQKKASKILSGICHGIQYIQNQMVIHRDLKPQNIFLCFDVPKIGDFGWAVYLDQEGKMRKTVSGSPLYYSPEIVKNEEYDQKIDIWGIGVIAYECLVGMAPFKIYSLINLNKIVYDSLSFPSYVQISSYAVDFIENCLAKKPQNRWNINQALKHQFIKIGFL